MILRVDCPIIATSVFCLIFTYFPITLEISITSTYHQTTSSLRGILYPLEKGLLL